jgi:hypothetical protein
MINTPHPSCDRVRSMAPLQPEEELPGAISSALIIRPIDCMGEDGNGDAPWARCKKCLDMSHLGRVPPARVGVYGNGRSVRCGGDRPDSVPTPARYWMCAVTPSQNGQQLTRANPLVALVLAVDRLGKARNGHAFRWCFIEQGCNVGDLGRELIFGESFINDEIRKDGDQDAALHLEREVCENSHDGLPDARPLESLFKVGSKKRHDVYLLSGSISFSSSAS